MAHRTIGPGGPVRLPFGETIPHGLGSLGLIEVDRRADLARLARAGEARMTQVGPVFSPTTAGLRAAAASGFFPELVDPGADVRVAPPLAGSGTTITVNLSGIPAGADLRDFSDGFSPQMPMPAGPVVINLTRLVAMLGPAGGAVLRFFAGATAGAVRTWNSLPGWVQTILLGAGVAWGTGILMDIVGDSRGDGRGSVPELPGLVGGLPSGVIGQWVANGVTFYRLADGRLAVQNKRGRWKVWRPKRPVVLMPGGANNLRTLLRADSILNRQSKQIAAMLNRRGQRRLPARKQPTQVLVAGDDVVIGGRRGK